MLEKLINKWKAGKLQKKLDSKLESLSQMKYYSVLKSTVSKLQLEEAVRLVDIVKDIEADSIWFVTESIDRTSKDNIGDVLDEMEKYPNSSLLIDIAADAYLISMCNYDIQQIHHNRIEKQYKWEETRRANIWMNQKIRIFYEHDVESLGERYLEYKFKVGNAVDAVILQNIFPLNLPREEYFRFLDIIEKYSQIPEMVQLCSSMNMITPKKMEMLELLEKEGIYELIEALPSTLEIIRRVQEEERFRRIYNFYQKGIHKKIDDYITDSTKVDQVLDIMECYEDDKNLIAIISIVPRDLDSTKLARYAEVLCDPFVSDMTKDYDKNDFNEYQIALASSIKKLGNLDITKRTIRVIAEGYDDNNGDVANFIGNANTYSGSIKIIELVLDIIEKYKEHITKIWMPIADNIGSIKISCLEELMKDYMYKGIIKSKDPKAAVKRIIKNDYADILHKVQDKDFFESLSLSGLDYFGDTIEHIKSVHKERNSDDMLAIMSGFYDELDRAIAQGSDYKSKMGNLKRYCLEVNQQLRDNVSELMLYA